MTDEASPELVTNSAVAVANWFISKNQADPSGLTHLKIQKMLYFAQGWHLAYFDMPLFVDPIEAWKFGPVVTSVYYAVSSRRDEVISDQIMGYVVQGMDYLLGTPQMSFRDEEMQEFMQSIWDSYSKEEAWKLVSISHAKGSPWDKVSNLFRNNEVIVNAGHREHLNLVIPVELMRSYFKSLLALES